MDDIKETLKAIPGWHGLNAYERTKLCCAELVRRGERVPSWMGVRGIIGKGSSNDINRGKDDFREEHAAAMKCIEGHGAGLPDAVVSQANALWLAALGEAGKAFEAKSAELGDAAEDARLACLDAQTALGQAQARRGALETELAGLKGDLQTLQASLEVERIARVQAEQRLAASQEELAGQRDSLKAALENSQKELASAITRLEGAENHALMEIGRVKADAQGKVDALETKAAKAKQEHVIGIAVLEKKVQGLATENAGFKQQAALLSQDNAALKERLHRAEAQADRLAADNASLSVSIRQLSAKPTNKRPDNKSPAGKKNKGG